MYIWQRKFFLDSLKRMDSFSFLSILTKSKPKPKDLPKNTETKSFHSIFKKLNFPKISENELTKLKERCKNGEPLGQIIITHIKEIEYDANLVKKCFDSLSGTKLLPTEEAVFYIEHSVFAWLFFVPLLSKQLSIELMLESTAILKEYVPSNIAASFFKYIINHIMFLFNEFETNKFIPAINIFFTKESPEDKEVFEQILEIFYKSLGADQNVLSNASKQFLAFFAVLFSHHSLVTPTICSSLFNHLQFFLSIFDLDIYRFFQRVLFHTKAEGIFQFFSSVFKYYELAIESGSPIYKIVRIQKEPPIQITLPNNPQFTFQLNSNASIMHDHVLPKCHLPQIQPVVPKKLLQALKALILVSKTNETQMIVEQLFITLIQSKSNSPYFYDYIYAMVTVLLSFEASDIISKILEIVLSSSLFDPAVTIMNSKLKQISFLQLNSNANNNSESNSINSDSTNQVVPAKESNDFSGRTEDSQSIRYIKHVLQIRAIVYNLLFRNFKHGFGLFMKQFLSYPQVMTELFLFMGQNTNIINFDGIQNPSFIPNLIKISMNYFTAAEENEGNNKEIKELLESFAIFLSNLLRKKEISDLLFQSDSFVSMFFSFIFTPFLRSYIISSFEYAVLENQLNIPDQAVIHILSVFESSKHGEQEDEYILMYDILILLNSILSKRSEMISSFIDILENICYINYHFKLYSSSEKLLLESIKFYQLYDNEIQFDTTKCLSFANCIQLLYGDEPTEQVHISLVSLMTHNSNTIIQPHIAVLILKAFANSTRGTQFLIFILELCKLASQNAITLHSGRFDICLLEWMNIKKAQQTSLDDFIKTGLKIIEKMAGIISSTPVVKQFIGLLCPINTKYISLFHIDFLNSLLSIINQKKLSPTGALPLNKSSSYILVNDLRSTHFQKGFEITLWIFPENPTNNVHLLTIYTKDNHKLSVYIQHKHLILNVKIGNKKTTYSFDLNMIPYKWFFISLNVVKKNDEASVSGFFDETKFPIFSGNWNDWQFSKYEVGINTEETGYQLGAFGIFPQPNEVSLYSQGPDEIPQNALFYIVPELTNELLSIKCETSSSQINAELIGPDIIQRNTFADALVKICTIDVLLPLYAQLDLNHLDNSPTIPEIAVIITEIFSVLLSISIENEKQIMKSNGISIIGSLLSSIERTDILTFKLYLTFYEFFKNSNTKALKSQIFHNILMSFRLWSRASSSESSQVLKHWESTLYKEFMPNSAKLFSFVNLLLSLNQYFPYNSDPNIISGRQAVINLLYFVSTTEYFKEQDFRTLIGVCIQPATSNTYSFHICDMISLIQMIVKTPNTPFEKFPEAWKTFAHMQILFNSSDENIIIFLIDLLANLHETSLFNVISFEQHINVMITLFAAGFSQNFYNIIITKAMASPAYFPLTFFIAYANQTIHSSIVNTFKPKNDIVTNIESLFWFFACIFKYDVFGDFLIDYIIKCSILPLKTTMCIIDTVGSMLRQEESIDFIKIKFVKQYVNLLKSNELKETKLILFEVALQILLYRRVGYSSLPKKDFIELYGHSFPTMKQLDFFYLMKSGKLDELSKELTEIENHEITFVFGVNMNSEKRELEYQDLAKQIENLIVSSQCTEFFDVAAILCYLSHSTDKYQFFIDNPSVSPEIKQRLIKANYGEIDSNTWYNIISKQFQKINDDYSSFIQKYLKMFCLVFKQIKDDALTIFSVTATNLRSIVASTINSFRENEESNAHETLKKWFHLWNQLTFERSPWEPAKKEQSSRHYKRDLFLCWNSFPAKLKLNFNFDDHRLASLMQETGDLNSAQRILDEEKKKEELEKQENEDDKAPALLKVTNEILKVESDKHDINDDPIESYEAKVYKLEKEKECKFSIFNSKIVLYFKDSTVQTIKSSQISQILMRGILHKPRGLEIFLKNGPSILIIFGRKEKNVFEILRTISSNKGWNGITIQTVPHKKFFPTTGIKEKWESGLMSNFKYLLYLNIYSGRSFNDPSMYPIFPWVVADNRSNSLDLKNPATFRDLSKPVGALNPERLEKLKTRPNPSDSFVREHYLYPSGYSSLLFVYLFLIRMEPFTSLHIKAQSGKFDHAPRQFLSIIKAYDMVNENIQDFRELTPEFFFDNSFLNNVNNFNFGKFEGVPIGDVELPNWAHNSIEYVYLNRKALESSYVSQHLNQWIDLIWGSKQNGQGAVEANNTFIPYLYESVWTDELINQPGKAEGAEAYLQTCGQIPPQLFFSNHGSKNTYEFPILLHQSETITTNIENICYAVIAESNLQERKLKLNSVNLKGNAYSITLKFIENQPQGQTPAQAQSYQITTKQWKGSFQTSELSMIAQVDSETLAVGTSLGKIELVRSKIPGSKSKFKHLGKITTLYSDETYLVTGGNDTATCVFDVFGNSFKLNNFFPSFRDDVCCCAVNSKYDLVVSGTRDSSLFFFSPTHKIVTKIIDLKGKIPQKILITNAWGFVVVYEIDIEKGTEYQYIEVFTVNGDPVISKQLSFQIQQWTHWESLDGFDYLLVLSKSGLFFTCEVFYMDLLKAIKDRIELKVLSLSYSYEFGIIVVSLSDGSIRIIPFRPVQK